MGFPGKGKFPIIFNHFAKCGHKGELSVVFSAIYSTTLKAQKRAVMLLYRNLPIRCHKTSLSAFISWIAWIPLYEVV